MSAVMNPDARALIREYGMRRILRALIEALPTHSAGYVQELRTDLEKALANYEANYSKGRRVPLDG
jgi:hypothetical protein